MLAQVYSIGHYHLGITVIILIEQIRISKFQEMNFFCWIRSIVVVETFKEQHLPHTEASLPQCLLFELLAVVSYMLYFDSPWFAKIRTHTVHKHMAKNFDREFNLVD